MPFSNSEKPKYLAFSCCHTMSPGMRFVKDKFIPSGESPEGIKNIWLKRCPGVSRAERTAAENRQFCRTIRQSHGSHHSNPPQQAFCAPGRDCGRSRSEAPLPQSTRAPCPCSRPSANICSNFRMIPAYRLLRRRKVILSGEFPLGFLPE